MDYSRIDPKSVKGKLLRLPLRLLRPGMIMPILSGPLRGKKWVVGSSVHGCWLGTYEYEKQMLFSRIVSPKSTVFDMGGNVGFYTLLASKRVGPDGKVFVFEPLPRNLSYLRKHLELNQANNVTVIDAALSDKNGFAFFDAGPRGEMAHIASSGKSQVRTWTLDHLLELGQIQLPDCIKMDIEEAEFDALRGAKSLLSKAHPTIFLATHGTIVHRECCGLLQSLGYRLVPIDGNALENSREIIAVY
jgi:FkbM family methyltransferase